MNRHRAKISSATRFAKRQPTGDSRSDMAASPTPARASTATISVELQSVENAADVWADAALQPHLIADAFPLMNSDELGSLAEDIKTRGLLEPIMRLDGQFLDGRNRYLACQRAGVNIRCEEYKGDDPIAFVLSRNVCRRHLSERQRAMVAARLSNLELGANQHNEGVPIGRASQLLNVSLRSVARCKQVLKSGVPDLIAAVDRGSIPVSSAAKISKLPQVEQLDRLARPNPRDGQQERPSRIQLLAEIDALKAEVTAKSERLQQLEQQSWDRAGPGDVTANPANLAGAAPVDAFDIPAGMIRLSAEDEAVLAKMIAVVEPFMEQASLRLRRRFVADLESRFGQGASR